MNLCGLNIPSNSHALLTHWMLRSIAVTDSFPRSAVPTLGCRVSVVSFVAFIFFFFMFFAKPALSKLWTAWKRTWSFRLSRHNERNPCCQLLTGSAEDSDKTAIVRCEEGGDDVKSARPLRPGLHTCYNGGYRGPLPREWMPIPKTPLSSDWSLQPDSTKLDSLVIAHQPRRGEYVPGPCTHRPSSHGSRGYLKCVTARIALG